MKLIIVGAGGLGLEILDLVDSINTTDKSIEVVGFLDDNKIGYIDGGFRILGKISDLVKYKGYSVIIAIANPKFRKKVFDDIKAYDISTPNIIHPSAFISRNAKLKDDAGIIINNDVHIGRECVINEFTIVDSKSYLGHEAYLESFVTVYPSANISGRCKVHTLTEIGLGSNVIQGVTIGSNVIIGAGSTVIRNIENNMVAVGSPCKPIKER